MRTDRSIVMLLFVMTAALSDYAWTTAPMIGGGGRDSVDALLQRGQQLYSDGEYSRVIKTFLNTGLDTTEARASLLLGMSYSAINDFENASRFLKRACRMDSSNISYRYQLALFSAQNGLIEDARQEYEHIVALDSSYLPALSRLAIMYHDQKLYDQSRFFLNSILGKNPRDFLAHYYLGTISVAQNHQDSAIVSLRNCLQLNGGFVPAIDVLASLYYSQKDYANALQLYQRALELRPTSADFHYKVGLCLRQQKEYERAIPSFKKAVSIDTTNAVYFAQLGYCYYFTTRCDSSVFYDLKAISFDPENLPYYVNLALAYQKLDSMEKTVGVYKKMIEIRRPDEVAYLYFQIGSEYFSKRRNAEAIEAYKKALTIRPSYLPALFYLGTCYQDLQNIPAARRTYEEWLHVTESDSTENAMKGLVKYRLKSLKK